MVASLCQFLNIQRETGNHAETKVILKMRTHTFKLFHLRVTVVMLQLFRQSFDSHDDISVFNNECVKVSEERRWYSSSSSRDL
jgi:hypothetical protein